MCCSFTVKMCPALIKHQLWRHPHKFATRSSFFFLIFFFLTSSLVYSGQHLRLSSRSPWVRVLDGEIYGVFWTAVTQWLWTWFGGSLEGRWFKSQPGSVECGTQRGALEEKTWLGSWRVAGSSPSPGEKFGVSKNVYNNDK